MWGSVGSGGRYGGGGVKVKLNRAERSGLGT